MRCPKCNRELKIECSSGQIIDGRKKKMEKIGSCEKCLADYFWIEVIDEKGNKMVEEFRRYFCG